MRPWMWMFAFALAACGGSPKAKPVPPTDTPPPATATARPERSEAAEQAALAEQYDLGRRVYTEKKCASCHGSDGTGNPTNPPVIGAGALLEQAPAISKLRKGVAFRTAGDVLTFVKAKMPLKQPGTLTDEEAAAVTSWMLSESKVDITRVLDAASAGAVKLR